MKKYIAVLIGVAALLATVTVQAQEGGYPLMPVSFTLPAVIPAANDPTNFASPILLDLGKTKTICPWFTTSSSVNATNVVIFGAWSGDGVNFDTNDLVALHTQANASIPLVTTTNILTGNGRRYFLLISEQGTGGGVITNGPSGYDATKSPW